MEIEFEPFHIFQCNDFWMLLVLLIRERIELVERGNCENWPFFLDDFAGLGCYIV
jgi:hypothetical protein